MRGSNRRGGSRGSLGYHQARRAVLLAVLMLLAVGFAAGCGGETASGGSGEAAPEETGASDDQVAPDEATSEGVSPGEISSGQPPVDSETPDDEYALTPADATVGPNESGAMPAGGKEKDPSQEPPRNPPRDVQTFPATTNRNVSGPVTYEQDPPANGDHAPYWQNCGFYSSPVETEAAVHSLDHGVVWLTYRPDLLPAEQIDALRGYGQEEYVLVSPYPDQADPLVATAWRNQLRLSSVDDPRLRQFVDQFRISETSPRSGNGCTGGVGEPES